jgi:Rap1a immunity proteins
MSDQFRFCPPPGISTEQAIPILMKYLDQNPDALKYDMRNVANAVFHRVWPCQ